MAIKNMAYDHPAYIVPENIAFIAGTNPSGNVAQRQVAYADMNVRALTFTVGILGTNTSTVAVIRVAGTNTGTSTIGSLIIGTGVVTGTSIGTSVGQSQKIQISNGSGVQIYAGDLIAFQNGVDVSVGVAVGVEAYITPGANLTYPGA